MKEPAMKEHPKIEAGGLKLDNALWLAPLAGVTTPPVREFFSRLGAGLTHTEMVSCAGIVRGNRKTEGMLRLLPGEGPVVLQLFAGDAASMREGAEAAIAAGGRAASSEGASARFAALGVNMACPMPKVTKRGAGAALMNVPGIACEMVRGLKELGFPVWVKTRKAPSGDETDTLRFAEGLLNAGADNVCIHGRTPAQRYGGRADRSVVCAAARRFPGKISASGDVYSAEDVLEYLNGGCVGVMPARGALANPYIFPLALKALGYDVPEERLNPAFEDRLLFLRSLGESSHEINGPRPTVVLLKRLLAGALKGSESAAALRRRAGLTNDLDELMHILTPEKSR
ncbi:MAG: tRNA-dihydrouridine synthase family protein [Synergistaceae bacterium]|jgi:tRNA-dihydrouridine synthase|nr:tRNA-dihydrouridine synthase family protein [Synergistaceae bacterium]